MRAYEAEPMRRLQEGKGLNKAACPLFLRLVLALVVGALCVLPLAAPTASKEAEKSGSLQLKLLRTFKSDYIINRLAWHPRNKELAVGQNLDRKITIWNADAGQVIRVIEKEVGGVGALTYSPDGKYLAVGRNFTRLTPDHAHIHLYDTVTGKLIQRFVPPAAVKGDANDVDTIAFSPDSKYLAASGYGGMGTGAVYVLATGEVIAKLGDGTGILHSLAFSPDGRWLAVGRTDRSDGRTDQRGRQVFNLVSRVQLWNTTSWKQERQTTVPAMIHGLAFSPNSKYLAVGSGVPENPSKAVLPYGSDIHVLESSSFTLGKHFLAYGKTAVASLSYSPDGKLLFTGGAPAKMIDAETGAILQEVKFTPTVHFPSMSPNGRYLAIVGTSQEIRLYECTH
jgi:WD40 repeat protein